MGGERKHLEDDMWRDMARRMRDHHWNFAERAAKHGTVWVCWWDKDRRHREEPQPDDLEVCSLISGMELLEWLKSHEDWWEIGEWSDERYAAPVTITTAGRAALENRDKYDLEPVTGGLVEPGWQAIPWPNEIGTS